MAPVKIKKQAHIENYDTEKKKLNQINEHIPQIIT